MSLLKATYYRLRKRAIRAYQTLLGGYPPLLAETPPGHDSSPAMALLTLRIYRYLNGHGKYWS